VLHQGKLLAQGEVADVIAKSGGSDLNAAFLRLTRPAGSGGTEP
jgi:hypothetical protein